MECPHCKKQYERETLLKHLMVCPDCGCHMRMDVPDRIAYIADKDTFEELDPTLRTMNPIQMAGYEEKVSAANARLKVEMRCWVLCRSTFSAVRWDPLSGRKFPGLY